MVYFYGFKGHLVAVEFDLDRHGHVVPVYARYEDGTELDVEDEDLQRTMYQQDVAEARCLYK